MPETFNSPDIVIAGAGIIGLTLALELHARGAQVIVLERDIALSHASSAAAGMLAAEDPHMLEALRPLARLSVSLYPVYLARIAELSGIAVLFQTETTWQYIADGNQIQLEEHSLDPRQLASALLVAVRATSIHFREHAAAELDPASLHPRHIVHASGAWFRSTASPQSIHPIKGQMLRVQLPPALRDLREVHRSEQVYIAPRTSGPQAGTALIGATVEDAGFDTTTCVTDLTALRAKAARLLPALADEAAAPQLEAWAGLRPATLDRLPLIGPLSTSAHEYAATGHFRDGILLAPATAAVLADLIEGRTPSIDIRAFSPARFAEALDAQP